MLIRRAIFSSSCWSVRDEALGCDTALSARLPVCFHISLEGMTDLMSGCNEEEEARALTE